MLQIKNILVTIAVLLCTTGIARAEITVDWLMDDALSEVYLPFAQSDIVTPHHIEQALMEYRNGNYRYSVSILERLQQLQLPDGRLDFVLLALGECYRQMKMNTLAAQQYETLVRLFPNTDKTAPAYFRLLQYAFDDMNSLRADTIMGIFQKKYTTHPLFYSSQYLRAKLFYREDRYNDVLSLCGSIPERSKVYYQARFLSALANIRMNDPDKAIAFLEDISKHSETVALVQNALMLLGDVHYTQKKLEKALEYYEKIPESSKKYSLVQVRIGRTYLDLKKYDKACEIANSFIQNHKTSEYVFEMLSVLEQAYSDMKDEKNNDLIKQQMMAQLKQAESSFQVYEEVSKSSLMINQWELIELAALQNHDTASLFAARNNMVDLNTLRMKLYGLMGSAADSGKYSEELASMTARRYLDILKYTMEQVKDSITLVQKEVDSMFTGDSQNIAVNDSLLELRTTAVLTSLDSVKNRYASMEREYCMVVKECMASDQGQRKRDEEMKAKFVDWAFQRYLDKKSVLASGEPSADTARKDSSSIKDTVHQPKNDVAAVYSELNAAQSQRSLAIERSKLIENIKAMQYAYPESKGNTSSLYNLADLYYDQSGEACEARLIYAPAALFRLAELYYDSASEVFDSQLKVYEKKIADGAKGLEFPEYDLRTVIETYNQIINGYPRDQLADDAYYYKGLALQKMNKYDDAQQTFLDMVDQYPRSEYFVEATMNIARYYFEHPKIQGGKGYQLAQESYQKVLAFPEHPQFVPALYGLGWCYYMMDEYEKTTDVFKYMIQTAKLDFNITDSLEKKQIKNPLLRDDAVDCIAISFDEKRRIDDAVALLNLTGSIDYGATVIKRIAELREEDMDYSAAIAMYERLGKEYAQSIVAPDGILGKIKMFELQKKPDEAQLEREVFLGSYIRGGQWQESVRHRDSLGLPRIDSIVISMGLYMGDQNYRLAEAKKDVSLYTKSAHYYQMIINAYPGNPQALDAQWNLALIYETKLNSDKDAYTEYIKLSRKTEADQEKREQAALNALAIAQKQLVFDTLDSKEKMPELPEQFVAAVNNYRELFPDGKHLSSVLLTVGPIYFNKKMYAQAAEYFELIVKRGPLNDDFDQALFLLAKCHFGMEQWLEASKDFEMVWKSTSPKAPRTEAYKFLLQSEFARAKQSFNVKAYKDAAQIFLSIEDRYPNSEYGDAVLFKAAESYEQFEAWDNACNCYVRIANSYPRSKLAPSALFNAANNYEKINQFDKAAETYEKLVAGFPESDKIKDAMFNLGLCYEKAGKPDKMAEADERYAKMFPGEKDVEIMLLRTADYYTKAKMEAKAVTIYQNFIRQFPKSLKTVDAYYFIGKTYLGWNDRPNAYLNFSMAEQQNMKFMAAGAPVGSYYAAEAAYNTATMKREEYSVIKPTLPESKFNVEQKAKTALLIDAVKSYERVVQYQSDKMFEAAYRIGELYQDAADSWKNQERIPLDSIKMAVKDKDILQTSSTLLQKSFIPYKKTIELAGNFDSLTLEQKSWVEKAKTSLAQNYLIAGLDMVAAYTGVQNAPIPADIRNKPLYYYQYRKQVLEAMEPMKEQAKTYFKTTALQLDSLKLSAENGAQCRDEYLHICFSIANEYEQLAEEVLHKPAIPEGMTPEQKEDLTFNLEDIGFELQDKALLCYEDAQKNIQDFEGGSSNIYSGKINQALARLNPDKYGKNFFMPLTVASDGGWFARSDSIAGWNSKQVPTSGWHSVSDMPPVIPAKFPAGISPQYVWTDSGSPVMMYLWKHMFIPGVPRNAIIRLSLEGKYQLFINGTLTAGDTSGVHISTKCDSIPGMAKLFKGGDNDVAVLVTPTDSLTRGIALSFSFLVDTTEHFTPNPAYTQFSGYRSAPAVPVQPKPPAVQHGNESTLPGSGKKQDTIGVKVPVPVDTDKAGIHADSVKVQKDSAANQLPIQTSRSTSDTVATKMKVSADTAKGVNVLRDTATAHKDTVTTGKKPPISYVTRDDIMLAIDTYNQTAYKAIVACNQEQSAVSELHTKLNKIDLQMKRIRDEIAGMMKSQKSR